MKKIILLTLALAVSAATLSAQKSEEATKKAVASAKAAADDPKKAVKTATWLKLAQTYLEAYSAPSGKGILGMTKDIINGTVGVNPISSDTETVNGEQMQVDIYPNCKYYYSGNVLSKIVITKPFVENALEESLKAYAKAAELDSKGSKTEDIRKGIEKIVSLFNEDGLNAYSSGNYAKSSELFEKAYLASIQAPSTAIDTGALYNAGYTAQMGSDFKRAIPLYKQTVSYAYYQNGDIYARLGECLKGDGAVEEAKQILQEGFVSFPNNQGILIGLINLYIETKDDAAKVIDLIHKAQANDPNNASLHYVEGNLCKQLGEKDKALEAYDRCSTLDPTYPFGEIGKAILWWEDAQRIREEANNEMDQKKYDALAEQYEVSLLQSADNFERGYQITTDEALKRNVADYLKSIYFLFREKDDKYKAAYEKYAAIAKGE